MNKMDIKWWVYTASFWTGLIAGGLAMEIYPRLVVPVVVIAFCWAFRRLRIAV